MPDDEPSQHDHVSEACAHREHDDCRVWCEYCSAQCLCACHHWRFTVERS